MSALPCSPSIEQIPPRIYYSDKNLSKPMVNIFVHGTL